MAAKHGQSTESQFPGAAARKLICQRCNDLTLTLRLQAANIYLPNAASNLRVIAVAEKDGKVLGGILSEDSIVVSLIGQDPSVVESAGEWMTQIFVAQARKERTRFLQSSVPARLVARLDEALQKVGFKPLVGTSYRLDTGIEAAEQDGTRRN
jgi:hypothetical protein